MRESASQRGAGGRGVSSGRVLTGLFALMLLACGIFAALYYKVLFYERTAARHIPDGTTFAARLDLEQIVLFAPLREHVMPVLLDAKGAVAEKERLDKIEAATGVNLGMDVREVVIAHAPAGVGVVIGGRFPRGGVVEGFAGLLAEEGNTECRLDSAVLSCRSPAIVAQQAADGTVVMATSMAMLQSMLPTGTAYHRLGLEVEGPGSFGLLPDRAMFDQNSLLARLPVLAELNAVDRIHGAIELDEEVSLTVVLEPTAGADLSAWLPKLEQFRDLSLTMLRFSAGRDYGGERAVLERLRFTANETGSVVASAVWNASEIDQAARSLAALLSGWFSQG